MQKKLIIPPGMKDILPGEAYEKRKLEGSLMALFGSWGYQEVGTSSLEYYDVVAKDGMDPTQVFKLIDREGRILALRPDVTTPIARMVASRLQAKPLPLRLCYTGSTFRYEQVQVGRQREFTQAGVELIGSDDLMADIEVLMIAIESLQEAGIENFRIGIGEINITEGFLREMLSPDDVEEARQLIMAKDFVALKKMLRSRTDAETADVFMTLVSKNGGAEILDSIGRFSGTEEYQVAVACLKELARVLEDYGILDLVFFDFSILRNFRYYTGIVFEGYAQGLGHPICGGGRYDSLLGDFGMDVPAVGFALGLERALLAGGDPPPQEAADVLILGDEISQILRKARELRAQGQKVEIDLSSASLDEAQNRALEKGIDRIYLVEGGFQDE